MKGEISSFFDPPVYGRPPAVCFVLVHAMVSTTVYILLLGHLWEAGPFCLDCGGDAWL